MDYPRSMDPAEAYRVVGSKAKRDTILADRDIVLVIDARNSVQYRTQRVKWSLKASSVHRSITAINNSGIMAQKAVSGLEPVTDPLVTEI